MISTQPNKIFSFLEKVTETALVGSRLAPCCPNHMKRGQPYYIDKVPVPQYLNCPQNGCKLLHCNKCYKWHEYVSVLKRTCEQGYIVCPVCKTAG